MSLKLYTIEPSSLSNELLTRMSSSRPIDLIEALLGNAIHDWVYMTLLLS